MLSSISKRKKLVVLTIVIIAIGVTAAILAVLTVSNSNSTPTIVTGSRVTYQGGMTAYATFVGFATYYVRAECPRFNQTNECILTTSVSLNVSGPFPNLYTKSIFLKLANGTNSVFAVGFNTYTDPAQEYKIGYGYTGPNIRYVVVEPTWIARGSTWTFTVNIQNPPVTNGSPSFSLMLEAIVAQDTFLGKTFDLQGTMQLPSP